MHFGKRAIALGLILSFVSDSKFISGEEVKRGAIPPAAAQKKAEALIRELYEKEYAKAEKGGAARAQLAVTLLQEGRDTNDDPAGRYVLFREARDLAAKAGDAPVALQAIADLAQDFAVADAEVLRMKILALQVAGSARAGPEAYHMVVDTAQVLAHEAVQADDYEAALDLLTSAEAAAKKLKIVSLVSAIRKRQEEVVAAEKEYARWKPFAETLRKDPTDARANLEMGRYFALVKGNWDKGLGLLARGSDPVLKDTAAMDLEAPKDAGPQAELADKWFQISHKFKGKMAIHALLRAFHWDVQALAGLEGDARKRVEKRMDAITQFLPPEYRAGEIAEEIRKIPGNGSPVYAAALSPDGARAASGGADNNIYIWDWSTGKEIRRLEGHNGRVWTLAFSPDGRRLASGGFDSSIRLWDLASGREAKRLSGHTDYVRSLAFSRDGRLLLSGGDDRMVRLWNTESGREIKTFPGHDHFVWSVALSGDGKHALSGSLDKTVRLRDLSSGKEVRKLIGHKDTVLSVAFSPAGRHALSGSTDKTLILWDLETGKPIRTFTGHKGYVNSVAFSPDGRRALSAGQDGTLILWDVYTGKALRHLEAGRPIWSVAFSRDGRLAITGQDDGTIRIWGSRQHSQVSNR
jgi:WD40 repeat protein